MTKIRIGTRKSKLAMAQSKLVTDAIKAHWPDVEIELVPMTTTGDRLPGPLDKMGAKDFLSKSWTPLSMNAAPISVSIPIKTFL